MIRTTDTGAVYDDGTFLGHINPEFHLTPDMQDGVWWFAASAGGNRSKHDSYSGAVQALYDAAGGADAPPECTTGRPCDPVCALCTRPHLG